ncbi:MAG: ATP synthase F1 subunit delta [Flavobacteriales bacterium]|jgi:F-type H+-transporting ATPase subunit delta|nr:ATP synthase F1 subunit delta [Flavobacteriales bacterium]
MNIAPVAYRYARSLMDLATEQGQVEAVHADMGVVAATTAASRELRVLLNSPVVKADKKSAVLDKVFGGRVGEVAQRFMAILVRKGREGMLPQVAAAVQELYKRQKGIVTAEVTSAAPLDDSAREQVRALATARHPGKTVELDEHVDPELIGGLTIRIGDEQYDGSVSRRLSDLRREFSKNPYIPAI